MYVPNEILDGIPKSTDLLGQLQKMEAGIASISSRSSSGSDNGEGFAGFRLRTVIIKFDVPSKETAPGSIFSGTEILIDAWNDDVLIPIGVVGYYTYTQVEVVPLGLYTYKPANSEFYALDWKFYCTYVGSSSSSPKATVLVYLLYASPDAISEADV